MNFFEFFERKDVLTCDDVEWCQFQIEAARVGLDGYTKFTALPDIGPHQSFSHSMRQILIDFYESKAQTLLHLEDDCVFQSINHLEFALNELPAGWDIVYLGANLLCWNRDEDPRPERVSEHLFKVSQAWTTHCVGFNRKVVPFLLENQPGFSEQMWDQFASEQLPNLNAYVVAPMVAYQRPHVSAIWNRYDDYTDIFEMSQERLR